MQKKKDKLLDKIVKKDFNNELEEVLEKKYFDENAKSLLLSILYKIELSYKDYKQVKQNVEPKDDFIQHIIQDIEKNCDNIVLVELNSDDSKVLGDKTFIVEKDKKRIISYPIERKILYSIAKIAKHNKIIKEDYYLINRTLSDVINVGNCINTIEPMRDFNGYSWTTVTKEIESTFHNLIYQNLILLVGNTFMNKWVRNNEYIIDYLETFASNIAQKYGDEKANQIMENLKELSILLCVKFDKKMKAYIEAEKKALEQEIIDVQDNSRFVKKATQKKKQITKEIKEIDETINNKEILQEEYIRRNKDLPLEEKIFSIRILSNMLMEKRAQKIKELENVNELLNPQKFLSYRKELEEKNKYFEMIEVENLDKTIEEKIIAFQKIFLQCYQKNLEKITTKQEMSKIIYEMRYYNLLPFHQTKQIFEVKELEEELDEIKHKILEKAQVLKYINPIAKEKNLNDKILKEIFHNRMIKLEDLSMKITKEKETCYLQILDDNEYEEKKEIEEIEQIQKKDLLVRLNKKIKVFN